MVKYLVAFLIIIVSAYLGVFVKNWTSFKPEASDKNQEIQESPKQATSSAEVSSTKPTPKPIPVHSGRTLNIPILTYHFIGNNPNPNDKARDNLSVTPDKFDEQMAFLAKNGYQAISFDTLYAILKGQTSLPTKPVILSFDDGYVDFYLNAYPILRKYNLNAVVFVPTGLIGGSYYMNWAQIKEINGSGLVSFQAHSVSHPNLTSLTDDQLKFQLSESKKVLESQLGKPVNTIAYPYGSSDTRVWQEVKNAGYIGGVGTWTSNVVSEGVILNIPRIKIAGSYDLGTFASKIQ